MSIIKNIRRYIPFYIIKRRNIHSNGNFHHYCVIFRRKGSKLTPIYTGYNCGDTHAEVNAIDKIKDDKNVIIFVFRLTKGNNLASSKPCSKCAERIRKSKIKDIYYSNTSEEICKIKINELIENPHIKNCDY